MHGCRTAVRHLRAGGGAIINVGSVASDRAAPLVGIYSAAKHAVKGYTDALRMELEYDGLPISVSLVKTEPEFMLTVYPPEEVARAILKCAEYPMRDVLVGGAARFLSTMGTTRQTTKQSSYTRASLIGRRPRTAHSRRRRARRRGR